MPATIGEMMTRDVRTLEADATAQDAAKIMRDENIGDVVITDGGKVCGIVTDRDLVVRLLADGSDAAMPLRDICSTDLVTLTPGDLVENAVQMMRARAIRRLPVVDGGAPVGIVSIGDLAIKRDPDSALADISAASPQS